MKKAVVVAEEARVNFLTVCAEEDILVTQVKRSESFRVYEVDKVTLPMEDLATLIFQTSFEVVKTSRRNLASLPELHTLVSQVVKPTMKDLLP